MNFNFKLFCDVSFGIGTRFKLLEILDTNRYENDLTCKRPGTGISPLYWDEIIGRKTLRNLPSGYILQWCDLDIGLNIFSIILK